MKKLFITLSILLCLSSIATAQVLILTISSITKSKDKKLSSKLTGSWIITKAQINGEDVSSQFDGVLVTFPKCKGKEVTAGGCTVKVSNDDNTDYFKKLFAQEPSFSITSRKEINKAAKAEDAEFEKVSYEMVQAAGSEYEFAFKYKKGMVTIQMVGEGGDELFQMIKAPKKKKKK